jgi:hypothetical protein
MAYNSYNEMAKENNEMKYRNNENGVSAYQSIMKWQ